MTAQHELVALRKQLDDTQQRWRQLETEHQELRVQMQNEKQATQIATEKCDLSTMQGYVLRACDELVMDCPHYNRPSSSPSLLKHMTKQRASRVLNCLIDSAALCSRGLSSMRSTP